MQEGCTTGLAVERAPRKTLPRLVDMLGSSALSSLKSMTRARETLTFSKARKREDVHSIKVQARAMGNPGNAAD